MLLVVVVAVAAVTVFSVVVIVAVAMVVMVVFCFFVGRPLSFHRRSASRKLHRFSAGYGFVRRTGLPLFSGAGEVGRGDRREGRGGRAAEGRRSKVFALYPVSSPWTFPVQNKAAWWW